MSNTEYATRMTIGMEIIGRRYATKINFDMKQRHALARIVGVVLRDDKLRRDAITLSQACDIETLKETLKQEFGEEWIVSGDPKTYT